MMVAGWVLVNVSIDLGIDRIFKVDESTYKIGTEAKQLDLA